ncbi:MAG: c-type cytochrome [Anaerolineales bacterium]|nr:c-type cytochrome [Anaerolineales bacterium]
MNIPQNRTRLFEVLAGLLATQLIVFGLGFYMLNEPTRIAESQTRILQVQLDDAMTLYAQNCSVCHGLAGEGISSIPALNNPALQTMAYDDLTKTIARGRFNTAMPAWSKEDGGALSDYQISELVSLIQSGDWNATQDRVVNLGLAPLVPFTTEPDPALLAEVANLLDGATLQTAITLFAANCVACHGADGLGSGIAPALNDPVVREKTVDELTRTVTLGSAGTLMAGWSNALTTEEIAALVTLVQRWDEVPTGILPAPDVPIPTTEESIALGGDLFAANCARCHGAEGQGTRRAPALNVKSFLTDTGDLAIQQIVTNGVPGTAMPVWGDRMTEADIQAIVGFIRQWEAAAPEVAVPAQTGGGGPPWLRNQTTTTTSNSTTQPNAQATQPAAAQGQGQATVQPNATQGQGQAQSQQGQGQGQGQGQAQSQPTEWWQTFDWRILLLAFGALSISFTLIFMGFESLRRKPPAKNNPPK